MSTATIAGERVGARNAIVFTDWHGRKVRRAWRAMVASATADEWDAAAAWYPERAAGVVDALLAIRPEWSRATACGVLSAFSPRCTWQQNVTRAVEYAERGDSPGLRDHVAAADRCVIAGTYEGALTAPKTLEFARAIDGCGDAVVVDTWMMTAAMSDRDAPTLGQYRQIAGWVRALAVEYGTDARTMQALVWILVRGSAG